MSTVYAKVSWKGESLAGGQRLTFQVGPFGRPVADGFEYRHYEEFFGFSLRDRPSRP